MHGRVNLEIIRKRDEQQGAEASASSTSSLRLQGAISHGWIELWIFCRVHIAATRKE
jgi:hypothetical protein